jgi:adenylate kinase family enzyme
VTSPLDRIVVVGTSGSGKSVLARRLSATLGHEHVELDDLYWLPGWRPREPEPFLDRVREVVARERWIVVGNYASTAAPLTWPRATAVVWLDYSFPVTFGRALTRTLRRALRREPCCNGNRETLSKAFLSRESILWWVLKTYPRHRREYGSGLDRFRARGGTALRFARPRDADAWLLELQRGRSA